MAKTDCVNIEANEENCPCSAVDCDSHGVCCECLRAHLDKNAPPACVKTKIRDSKLFRENTANLINQAAEETQV